jgi:outer membrane protein TolC
MTPYLEETEEQISDVEQEQETVASAQRFVDVASVRYKTGLDPYLNVFTAQAILLANHQTVITLRVQQMTSSVQLIESLGGGWGPGETAVTGHGEHNKCS